MSCIEDVIIYATTQQIFFWQYEQEGRLSEYYLELGKLMKGEGRNSIAALCHRYALHEAWRTMIDYTIFAPKDEHREVVDPYEIYSMARLHLLDIGSQKGLERLNELHNSFKKHSYHSRRLKGEMDGYSFTNRVNNELPIPPCEEWEEECDNF